MSFLGGFLPFISQDSHSVTGVDEEEREEEEEEEDILYDDYHSLGGRRIKRLGLAAEVESKRYHRRPLKRRKLRRSTTERYPEDDEKNQPDYKKFCRQVIRTIAANADGDNFRKVSMYQEIYYLISKYNIPVQDPATDIVFIIDKLCRNDGSLKRKVPHIDNTIEDPETNSFVYHSNTQEGGEGEFTSEYSSVAKFPQFPLVAPTTTSSPQTHGVYVSQLGEKFPGGFVKHRDFAFSQAERNHQPRPVTSSPPGDVYPRVVYSGPRQQQEEEEGKEEGKEEGEKENNKDMSGSVSRPDQSAASRTTDLYSSEERNDAAPVIEPITAFPHLDIDNIKSVRFLESGQPQDILVASSLSFGGGDSGYQQTGMSPGKVISDLSNHRRHDESDGGEEIRQFTPSEFVSSTVRSSQKSASTEPSLRKGTVEDIPAPRATLPPVVKTSKIKIENSRHPGYLDHLNSISSTQNPLVQTTFKTSKLRGHGQYHQTQGHQTYLKNKKKKKKQQQNYLQSIIEDFYEEPTRSREEEEGEDDYVRSGYSKHYAPASGFYPRPREPYPYKTLPRPLSPARPGPPRGRYPPREFDREEMLLREFPHNSRPKLRKHREGDKVSNTVSNKVSSKVSSTPPTTKSPKLQALTLKQLSAGLSVTTERADSERRQEGVTRDYTVFDMADAVTVTHPPLQEERLDNHQPELEDFNTLRPDYVEYDQSPSPANNHEERLLVDLSSSPRPEEETLKRNVSIDDLLFLYNITFLTDSQEITPSIGERNLIDHNIQLSEGRGEDYSALSSLPLPDYQALDTEEKFTEALEEFLEDYENYSYEQLAEAEDETGDDIEDVERMLSEMIGTGPLSEDLLGEVFQGEDDYYQYDILHNNGDVEDSSGWSAGHRVNHRTHRVPEFANQLISQKREGSAQSAGSSPPLVLPATLTAAGSQDVETVHHNHKPFYGDVNTSSKEGIKEVLMVLNATGKAKPKNRTRSYDDSNESRDGYYPERGDRVEMADIIDDDIENIHSGHMNDDTARDALRFEFSEQENDINNSNNNNNHIQNSETKTSANEEPEPDTARNVLPAAEEEKEKKFFYPVSDETNTAQEVSAELEALEHENLSDLIDSWDSHSDEIISNDEFISELEKERLEKAALEAELAANSLYEPENSENFPLKSFISDTESHLEQEQTVSSDQDDTINPEKLAYILIGVCCGLSIICLIVVAISIGYKSETHYRLEEPNRKHIRLLKANNSDEDSNSSSSEQDDKSRAKLGNWFTGKNHIETMERKSNMVFPTSVYLDNLASSTSHSTISRSQASVASSPSVGSEKNVNMFEVNTGADVGYSNEGSESSLSSVKTDPSKTYDADSIDLHLEQASKKKQFMKAHRNKSSYNLSAAKFSKGEQNLSQVGLADAQDKFRYKSQTTAGRRNSNATVKSNTENSREYSETEITWSSNNDRLI